MIPIYYISEHICLCMIANKVQVTPVASKCALYSLTRPCPRPSKLMSFWSTSALFWCARNIASVIRCGFSR